MRFEPPDGPGTTLRMPSCRYTPRPITMGRRPATTGFTCGSSATSSTGASPGTGRQPGASRGGRGAPLTRNGSSPCCSRVTLWCRSCCEPIAGPRQPAVSARLAISTPSTERPPACSSVVSGRPARFSHVFGKLPGLRRAGQLCRVGRLDSLHPRSYHPRAP